MKKVLTPAITLALLGATLSVHAADNTSLPTVDAFEKLFGKHKGKRRNHTKGFCFQGKLTPVDKQIELYSNASMFKSESTVIGRLSHKGGKLSPSDNKVGEYGMALAITTSEGQYSAMSMNTLDFFPVSTPQAFLELMQAKVKGKQALADFKVKYPEIKAFKSHMAKKDKTLKPYEAMYFNSINSFYLVNEQGKKTAVRWAFLPTKKHSIVTKPNQDFFFSNIQKNLKAGEVSWDMVITFANENDDINNAAKMWKGPHKQLTAARLTLRSVSSEAKGQCDNINYDPLALAPGIEPSADPILHARRPTYAIAFGRRLTEKAK
ncbi:catalase [Algicola sagamiensis]|uniref:catalase n=1 Tax=Algicola sagamiensis TaxID=163869 RepID=UPI0003641826|nr:catalase [Algicola sagamiensis]